MTDTNTNQAAWQRKPGQPLELGEAPVQEPGHNEILIRNMALGINPIDWLLQDDALLPWLDYPVILGSDTAGKVVAVGRDVTRFRPGDRVIGQAVGTTVNKPSEGTFQHHTIVAEHMAAPIPDGMAFTDAAVLPLGLGTAAVGLYGKAHLALDAPSDAPTRKDAVVLVWGGSSSVGCNAIQLAVASGYTCLTTASPRNAEMLKRLGATEVFDHAAPTVIQAVIDAMSGKHLVGVIHATGAIDASLAVAAACEGTHKVAVTLPPPADLPDGVTATHIIGPSLKDDDVGPMIYRDFLPRALAENRYVPAPAPRIVGHGLEAMQNALEIQKAGISGAKIVVTLT